MRKTIGKTVSRLLLAVLCAGALFVLPARAADITYELTGGKLTFDPATGTVKKVEQTVTDAVIPAEIQGVAVTKIGDHAFYNNEVLRNVTLPNSITSIGDWAFYNCDNLVNFTIPDSVTKAGTNLFDSCDSLSQVTIGRGLTAIPFRMLLDCRGLTSFDIPIHITSIEGDAFKGCTNLGSVTIPNSVKTIGNYAFTSTALTSVTIPDSVTKIGDSAFQYCSSLSSVKLSNSLTEIPMSMFDRCYALESIEIPNGVQSIGNWAFAHCSRLKSVTIPASVTLIAGFYDNEALTDVYYGSDVAHWGKVKGTGVGSATVHFTEAPVGPTSKPVSVFSDVKPTDYFAEAVTWAKEKGVTSGTTATTFSPNVTCTRAQIITFLWRASGSPEPVGVAYVPAGVAYVNDVSPGDYYYKAALWAVEKGMSGRTFLPNAPCTRAMAVEFIWKQAGGPDPETQANFKDVPSDATYARAVSWALEQGITSGTGKGMFAPNATCTRAQIATFLYRAFK